MKRLAAPFVAAIAAIASSSVYSAATCYQAIDPNGNVFYRSYDPPVDLSLKLSDAVVAKRYPSGTHIVMSESAKCPFLDVAPTGLTRVSATSADTAKAKAPAKKKATKKRKAKAQ
jgi:hypothetical protein